MLMHTGQLRSVIVVRSKCQANALDGFEPSENIYEPVKLKEFPPSSEDSGPEFHGNPPKFGWLVETPKKNGPKRHLLHRAVQGSGYLAPLGSVAQVASNC